MIDRICSKKGLVNFRREVMGDARVDSSMSGLDDFDAISWSSSSRDGWGAVWAVRGCRATAQPCSNLGNAAALGRMDRVRGHFRGASQNGLTKE